MTTHPTPTGTPALTVHAPNPTPDTMTVNEILDAVTAGIATYPDGWDALDDVGAPGRDEARRRICEAIGKQRGGAS